jgi:hypothetical protein
MELSKQELDLLRQLVSQVNAPIESEDTTTLRNLLEKIKAEIAKIDKKG